MSIYTEANIEDWDFRTNCDPESPDYSPDADEFLDAHFVTVAAVDTIRLAIIERLLRSGIAELDEDGRHVRMTRLNPDPALSGTRAAYSSFKRYDRSVRKVVQAMRREYKKYGRLRVTILPATYGASSEFDL